MNPITVLFFGSSGAGKGTQVKKLITFLESSSKAGIIHIDMGQELRNLRDTGTVAGKYVGDMIDNGLRTPDVLPIFLQTKKIFELYTGAEHIVADGLARGPEQTRCYDQLMTFLHRDNFQIIDLVISDKVAVKRLMSRGRNDDTEEGILKRLAWAKTDVIPQIDYFKNAGRTVHTINGEQDPDHIHQHVLQLLGLV